MLVSEITLAVQRSFGDDTASQITATDINRWINEAQLDIARKTDALLETTTIPTVVGQSAYVLPGDFLRVDRVSFDAKVLYKTNSQELDSKNPNRSASDARRAAPVEFYVRRKNINIYPAPEKVGSLTIEWVGRPALVTPPTDTPEVPVEYHAMLARYALSRAYELDGMHQEATTTMTEYNELMGWGIDEVSNPYTDSYPLIRSVD